MPALIHYFLSSLGRDAASCSDLMSYLLFTPRYTRELIEIGYHDASKRIDEIEDFLYSSQEGDAENPQANETGGNVPKTGSAVKRTEVGQISKVKSHCARSHASKTSFSWGYSRIERFLV